MPAIFNRAGYDTFRTCKLGNSYEGANQLFAVRHDATKRGGTAETGSAWHGDRAVEYLQRHASQDTDPFLMYLGFSHPHDVRDGTPELLKKYGARNVKQPPAEVNPAAPPLHINYLPKHPFHHGHPGLRDEEKVSGVFKSRSEATIRNELGRQFACIENIDIQIGRVIEQLRKMDELDDTYILFTSDHGMSIGRHGLTGKQNLYELENIALTGHRPMPDQINLADDPRFAEKRRELEALLLAEQKRLDDPYRLWDQATD